MTDKKLIWHIYPSYVLVIVVSLLLMLLYGASSFKTFYHNQTETSLKDRTLLIEQQVVPFLANSKRASLKALLKKQGHLTNTRFTVVDPQGVVLADSNEQPSKMDNHANRPEIMQALNGKWGLATRYSRTLQTNMLYTAKPIYQNDRIMGVIRSSISINDLNETLASLTKKMVIAGLFICLFSAMIGLLVAQKISRPIQVLTLGAEKFSKGYFDDVLPLPTTTELKILTQSLNNMASMLKEKLQTIEKHSNEKEAILEHMVEGVITVDNESKITSINKAASTYLSTDLPLVVGMRINEVVRHTDFQQLVQSALKTDQLIQKDIVLNQPIALHLHANSIGFLTESNLINGALIVLHDVTHLKQLEQMRIDFVANVSHELKTPITLIKGFLETLQSGAADNKQHRDEFLGIMNTHANRLETIIDDLLSLSKIERDAENGLIETTDCRLDEAITSAVQACQKKATDKHVQLNTHIIKTVCSVNASLIQQALINLIDNAIKYSPENSAVSISLTQDNTHHIMTVADEGAGIPVHHLHHLFERFYRVDKARSRDQGGTGLGLAIVKHIAQAHQGGVTVESDLKKGSTFSIRIPYIKNQEKKHV